MITKLIDNSDFFRYDRVMFLVISEDLDWCRSELIPLSKNVVVASELGSVSEDLALLTLGSHSIISIGTYGLWGAILAGGEIAFPASKISEEDYYVQHDLLKIKDKRLVKIDWKKQT